MVRRDVQLIINSLRACSWLRRSASRQRATLEQSPGLTLSDTLVNSLTELAVCGGGQNASKLYTQLSQVQSKLRILRQLRC